MEEQELENVLKHFISDTVSFKNENSGFLIPKNGKIQAYFTPAIDAPTNGVNKTMVEMDEFSQWETDPVQFNKNKKIVEKPCKPEHKVDGKVPMLYDLHFDGRTCSCGRVSFKVEECGCSIKEYRLIKIPNE